MKQFVVIAKDGKDADALPRRMNVRPEHLEGIKALKANGNYCMAGAILDDEGKMCGSVMILQFETDEQFQEWYNNEPYVKAGVWQSIEVNPFRVAAID